jgi:hypothetical protein
VVLRDKTTKAPQDSAQNPAKLVELEASHPLEESSRSTVTTRNAMQTERCDYKRDLLFQFNPFKGNTFTSYFVLGLVHDAVSAFSGGTQFDEFVQIIHFSRLFEYHLTVRPSHQFSGKFTLGILAAIPVYDNMRMRTNLQNSIMRLVT